MEMMSLLLKLQTIQHLSHLKWNLHPQNKKDLPAEPADSGIASLATEAEGKVPAPSSSNCGFSDILFVVDSTGSVHNVYELQRSYILQLAEQLTIGPEDQHVGLVLYSSKDRQEIVVELDAVPTKEDFLQIIKALPYHGGITATGAALSLAQKALEKRRAEKKTLVIVLTDGFSYDNTKPASDALNSLPNVVVVAAGDTDHFIQQVLEEMPETHLVLLGEENKPK
uniref:VWFA domain-containing protein n=1 Tax=Ditylenchus dipsaci TaxID=166011 RepID=A0A915CWJ6_9BILA